MSTVHESTIHEPLVLGPELAGTLMTPEEFDSAEDGDELYVYELINGVLIVMPPPDIGERAPNDLLGQLVRNYQDAHPKGKSLDYTVSEHTIRARRNRRRADRVIWAGLGRLPDPNADVPTIVIEYVSRGRRSRKRDYENKREEYESRNIGTSTVSPAPSRCTVGKAGATSSAFFTKPTSTNRLDCPASNCISSGSSPRRIYSAQNATRNARSFRADF